MITPLLWDNLYHLLVINKTWSSNCISCLSKKPIFQMKTYHWIIYCSKKAMLCILKIPLSNLLEGSQGTDVYFSRVFKEKNESSLHSAICNFFYLRTEIPYVLFFSFPTNHANETEIHLSHFPSYHILNWHKNENEFLSNARHSLYFQLYLKRSCVHVGTHIPHACYTLY